MIGAFYIQSSYSLLKSAIKLEDLIQKAKENQFTYLSISDDKNLYGMYRFLKLTQKANIKPVIGMYVEFHYDLFLGSLLVYAKNDEGLKNLIALSTFIQTTETEITIEDIKKYQTGLFFITPGIETILEDFIAKKQIETAENYLLYLKTHLKELYMGLSLQTPFLKMMSYDVSNLADKMKIKLLPIRKTNYLEKDEKEVYIALRKIQDSQFEPHPDDSNLFLTKEALKEEFKDFPHVFDHMREIINKITYKNIFNKQMELPVYPNKNNIQSSTYLSLLAHKGLERRLIQNQKMHLKETYTQRLEFELKTIEKMGYPDYFLIVYDFVLYAKTNGILVGPGRGSAAGSLVSYTLGITDIDPITYGLLFERFLNPERQTMPDIDMDFPDDKRDEVIEYVKNKYGKTHVASIITFGKFAIKSSLRDIARVMKIAPQRINAIVKRVTEDRVDQTDLETMRLVKAAKKIEGLPRHTGTHAAGIILSKDSLENHIPLQNGLNQMYQTQFEATDLEELGLLKIDFLGIRNLSVMDKVIKMVNLPFKIQDIDLEDEKTYELLSNADTTGIFQLESVGMRRVLQKLKPNTFEDIIAILALYRPGPMDHIDEYIQRRNGAAYEIIDPIIEDILKPTYGIIIYQEQIMQIASKFAGYTLAEADLLRRGISKKDLKILEEERKKFIQKALENNRDLKVAHTIYDYIVKFANYGFNRSHSVAYAMVAYQMAYLKANYFKEFMTVLLTSVINNSTQTIEYIEELKQRNIPILKPNIQTSTDAYQVTKEGVLLPLTMIKGIGTQVYKNIVEKRNMGIIKSYDDFKSRMNGIINERLMNHLIFSSALDHFGMNKKTLFENRSLEVVGYKQYLTDYKPQTYDEFTIEELVKEEQESYGFNIFYDLFSIYDDFKKKNKIKNIDEQNGFEIKIVGYITKIKEIKTKNQKQMAFISVTEGKKEIDVTIFPDDYQKYKNQLNKDFYYMALRKDKDKYVLINIKKMSELIKA